jgi:biotin carboxyl carrier protein
MVTVDAPIGGLVARTVVNEGQKVEQGQTVVVLNVMKTEIEIKAEVGGIVKSVFVKEWDEVDIGTPLVELE